MFRRARSDAPYTALVLDWRAEFAGRLAPGASLFECWLEDDRFRLLWDKLNRFIDPKQDRLAAYSLDAATARRREFAGDSMLATQPVVCYIV